MMDRRERCPQRGGLKLTQAVLPLVPLTIPSGCRAGGVNTAVLLALPTVRPLQLAMADAEDGLGRLPNMSVIEVKEAALVGTEEDVLDLPVIIKRELEKVAPAHGGYGTPRLNDTLYLHFKGCRRIENLEAYTALTPLWLHSNGFGKIKNLNHLQKLRCLFLQANAFTAIEGLDGLTSLIQLDLSENSIQSVAGLSHLPHLATLNLSPNLLKDRLRSRQSTWPATPSLPR